MSHKFSVGDRVIIAEIDMLEGAAECYFAEGVEYEIIELVKTEESIGVVITNGFFDMFIDEDLWMYLITSYSQAEMLKKEIEKDKKYVEDFIAHLENINLNKEIDRMLAEENQDGFKKCVEIKNKVAVNQ